MRAILSSVRPSHLFPEAMFSTASHKVLMTYIFFRLGSSMLPGVRVILYLPHTVFLRALYLQGKRADSRVLEKEMTFFPRRASHTSVVAA